MSADGPCARFRSRALMQRYLPWPVAHAALILISVLSLLNSTPALAQDSHGTKNLTDMSLEELLSLHIESVYGASGFKQKVTEAPASVTIVTSDEIQKYGYRTLADILRNVTGFYISYDGQDTYIGVRGISRPSDYNTLMLILVDGHRMNENV